jgi:hypothetical protein
VREKEKEEVREREVREVKGGEETCAGSVPSYYLISFPVFIPQSQ